MTKQTVPSCLPINSLLQAKVNMGEELSSYIERGSRCACGDENCPINACLDILRAEDSETVLQGLLTLLSHLKLLSEKNVALELQLDEAYGVQGDFCGGEVSQEDIILESIQDVLAMFRPGKPLPKREMKSRLEILHLRLGELFGV